MNLRTIHILKGVIDVFGFLKKNKDSSPEKVELSAFEGFKNNLHLHLNSISLFHHNINQRIEDIHSKTTSIDQKHDNNLEVIKQWIDFFNKKHKNTDDKLQIMANYIKQLQETIDRNKIANETFVKQIIDEYVDIPKIDKDLLKKEIAMELDYVENYVKNDPKNEIESKTKDISQMILTNSEKWLLNILFNSAEPLTYEQISYKTGKALNTIRVYMNSLKSKGSLIEENLLPNGSKVFAVTNKERIKKLYNIETM